ncbi:hypothetical protein [Pseudarthrobacter sulfonivorans]|uniref:hypothetical protein n=1 Tax=Pseudarthrobacter sulfonivorans TaxID=121292 RepID=UPI0027825DD5|nr:hypothetical protein [Pseudarthrobacter sulfonivorans]MDP9998407.1 hypothetical protein [Pseudarthrobacter sulfonivorans]
MRNKSLKAGATVIGSAALASILLTGCGGPKVTYSGMEVSNVSKAIESADALWAQNRASGAASNVDDESRCYAQVSEDVLSEKAICGPIHYLGSDDQIWESMEWEFAGDGKDKVQLTAVDSFSEDEPAANTTLLRADGKKAPADLVVPEPDTKTADSAKAIWGVTLTNVDETDAEVVTPESTISLNGLKVSDRVGVSSDRVKAGEGHKFASAKIEVTTPGSASTVMSELAITSGGKSYPLGKAKSGSVAMAVPGDGSDIALTVSYEGMTQTVSFADRTVQSTATAFYDDFNRSASNTTKPTSVKIGERDKAGNRAEFEMTSIVPTRTAYDPKLGWAPEGKAWLVVNTNVKDGGPLYNGNGGEWGKYTASYDTVVKVSSAKVKNVSGAAFEAGAARSDVVKDEDGYNGDKVTVVFEVPANVGDFTADFSFNSSGPKRSSSEAVAPATISVDASFTGLELIFNKK